MEQLSLKLKSNNQQVFSWCPVLEENAYQQIKIMADLPFIEHIAIMPDAHMGMQCPIGGVVATKDIIIPNFVGSDIGCGVAAIKTSIKKEYLLIDGLREKIYHSVCRSIPMGFNRNNQKRGKEINQKYTKEIDYIISVVGYEKKYNVIEALEDLILAQTGTCGGGNHYLEIDYDEEGFVWLTLHSGSRKIGKEICDYFNKLALDKMAKWHSINIDNIGFLPVNSEEGKSYLAWQEAALEFAQLNRTVMLNEMMRTISHEFPTVEYSKTINIHHNYATQESHLGKNLWVHRKGAVCAREEKDGIIPGSMGHGSYITQGLGNKLSLCSSSHGAGRISSRTGFNATHNDIETVEIIKKSMDGIIFGGFGKETKRNGKETGRLDLAESPMAYKSLDEVMNNQKDLVKIIHKLTPLINWKDTGEE